MLLATMSNEGLKLISYDENAWLQYVSLANYEDNASCYTDRVFREHDYIGQFVVSKMSNISEIRIVVNYVPELSS